MRAILLLVVAFLLPDIVLCEKQSIIMDKYREEIQKYIMTGHEKGWKHCDILSAEYFSYDDQPQMSMDLVKIRAVNIKTTFKFSSCLLVNYNIDSKASLATLIDFGRATIQHIRLALVVKLNKGITLDMITNTTNLAFLIAAELEEGKEQFLCPVVGEMKPMIEGEMCNPSFASYKEKTLRVALFGVPPYLL